MLTKAAQFVRLSCVTLLASIPMSTLVLAWVFMAPALGLAFEITIILALTVLWAGWKGTAFANANTKMRPTLRVVGWTAVCVVALTLAQHYWVRPETPREILRAVSNPWGVASLLLAVGAAAPLAEEALFRGYLLLNLRKHYSSKWSIALSAGVFALAHGDITRAPVQFIAAVLLGTIVLQTERLWLAVVAHGACNILGGVELGLDAIGLQQTLGLAYPVLCLLTAAASLFRLRHALIATEWVAADLGRHRDACLDPSPQSRGLTCPK